MSLIIPITSSYPFPPRFQPVFKHNDYKGVCRTRKKAYAISVIETALEEFSRNILLENFHIWVIMGLLFAYWSKALQY